MPNKKMINIFPADFTLGESKAYMLPVHVLSLLQSTDSDYSCGIFKHFWKFLKLYMFMHFVMLLCLLRKQQISAATVRLRNCGITFNWYYIRQE